MSVDDKLKNLRKSMKETSLKDIDADETKTKQYVMNRKKKSFLMNGTKRFGQIGASLVGLAALMLFVVYMGTGNFNLTGGDQSGSTQEQDIEEHRYEMVVIHDKGELENKEWQHLYNKQPMETYMKETRVLADESMEARRLLASDPLPEGMYFPVAYVFDTENNQLIYRTDQLEDLKDFLPRLYQSPEVEVTKGDYELSGLSLGDSFEHVLEEKGEAHFYSPKSARAMPAAYYKENGKFVLSVMLDEDSRVRGLEFEVSYMSETDLPETMEEAHKLYGEPDHTQQVTCSEQDTCVIDQFGQMLIKYQSDSNQISVIEVSTDKLKKEILDSYKPIEENTFSAIYVKGPENGLDIERVFKNHRGLSLSETSTVATYKGPGDAEYYEHLEVLVGFDLKTHGEVLLLNDEGEVVLRTKDEKEVDEFLKNWEEK
ncbi:MULTISPECIES: hypothetical protein [Pontibacillus]|uniref:DUF4825 domain-containing protein n=1 Tax=Pontibacillus chungwhensis TaxID=265426 RepID=A0ABY8V2L3_9BACI|nr:MULTISPECIES: hypothetical protein [Pontibacillus]MCD5324869.1 hypothetical protein [Pontibacillus sp. HN14]WIF98830.1 hypothetical protein QNI29_04020 [Pontibacillus chungwhensis]